MPTTEGGPPSEEEIASYLYAFEQWPQTEIAALLKSSNAGVSRLLAAAKERGLVREKTEFMISNPDRLEEIQMAVQARSYPQQLKKLLDQVSPFALRGVVVFDSNVGRAETDNQAWDAAIVAFGRTIAAQVGALLAHSRCIGVSWGRTILSAIQGLKQLGQEPRAVPPHGTKPQVLPLWGEGLGTVEAENESRVFRESEKLSSTYLAMELSRLLFGSAEFAFNIAGSPAVIPMRFNDTDTRCIKDFVFESPWYRKIFGQYNRDTDQVNDASALANAMDTLIAPVGTPNHPRRFLRKAVLDFLGTHEEELQDLVVGDIGSVLIPRADLTKDATERFRVLKSRILGLTEQQLRSTAKRASENDGRKDRPPGVIVIAAGAIRAEIIEECLRQGLINQLVIDESLATALTARIDRRQPKKRR